MTPGPAAVLPFEVINNLNLIVLQVLHFDCTNNLPVCTIYNYQFLKQLQQNNNNQSTINSTEDLCEENQQMSWVSLQMFCINRVRLLI